MKIIIEERDNFLCLEPGTYEFHCHNMSMQSKLERAYNSRRITNAHFELDFRGYLGGRQYGITDKEKTVEVTPGYMVAKDIARTVADAAKLDPETMCGKCLAWRTPGIGKPCGKCL